MGITTQLRDTVTKKIVDLGALTGATVAATLPPTDIADLPNDTTMCYVVAGPSMLEPMSTESGSSSASVHVAVYRKLSVTGDALTGASDDLVNQCDALLDMFLTDSLHFGDYSAGCQSIRFEPYDMATLHETGLFIGYALLTFEVC